jgi:hypothetical protein
VKKVRTQVKVVFYMTVPIPEEPPTWSGNGPPWSEVCHDLILTNARNGVEHVLEQLRGKELLGEKEGTVVDAYISETDTLEEY